MAWWSKEWTQGDHGLQTYEEREATMLDLARAADVCLDRIRDLNARQRARANQALPPSAAVAERLGNLEATYKALCRWRTGMRPSQRAAQMQAQAHVDTYIAQMASEWKQDRVDGMYDSMHDASDAIQDLSDTLAPDAPGVAMDDEDVLRLEMAYKVDIYDKAKAEASPPPQPTRPARETGPAPSQEAPQPKPSAKTKSKKQQPVLA